MSISSPPYDSKKLRLQVVILLAALGLQFLLGMATNLFVQIPDSHPGAGSSNVLLGSLQAIGWSVVSGFPSLALHAILGTGLVLGSIAILIRSFRTKDKKWIIVAVFGFLGILTAFLNGVRFVVINEDVNSFAMSLGFLIATVSYVAALLI